MRGTRPGEGCGKEWRVKADLTEDVAAIGEARGRADRAYGWGRRGGIPAVYHSGVKRGCGGIVRFQP